MTNNARSVFAQLRKKYGFQLLLMALVSVVLLIVVIYQYSSKVGAPVSQMEDNVEQQGVEQPASVLEVMDNP